MAWMCFALLRIWLAIAPVVNAAFDLAWDGDDSDLTTFVTRPEIKAPIFEIRHHVRDGVSPGYWFLAPYALVSQERFPEYYYQACSTGPHIYDGDGNLVWSGACTSRNSNACDFRVFSDASGTEYLSTIYHGYQPGLMAQGSAIDSSYDVSKARNLSKHPLDLGFNMHEFKVIHEGRSALYIMSRPERADLAALNGTELQAGWVSNIGFREVDLNTGHVLFEWWCLGDVSLAESSAPIDEGALDGPPPSHWNFFHPNSVDKSSEGDYMVSGRFVDTIYKISGKDRSIIWRLGGRNSSFHLQGFNFSKQHDAQFLGYDKTTGAELISFFDNAQASQLGWWSEATASTSSCLIVALDHTSMIATVVQRIWRPDGGITALRGNFQHLSNGNKVGAWSENAYVSEHAPDGRLLLEGRFVSKRFVTYRAYKFDWTGHPTEPPVLKAVVYGATPDVSTTAWHVSWNGATDVAQWRFCRDTHGTLPRIVGTATKTGFETTFLSDGFEGPVFVEALAQNGSVIGKSETSMAELSYEWNIDLSILGSGQAGSENQDSKAAWQKSEL